MINKFQDKAQRLIALSESVAFELGQSSVGTEHLLLAYLKTKENPISLWMIAYNLEENKLNTAWAVWCFGLLALNPAGTARNKFFYDQIRNLCQINTPDEDMLCVTSSLDKFLEFKEQDIVKQ